ncbi:MAG: methylmalonyl-CoA mutase family protein [Myxococcota bacterium]
MTTAGAAVLDFPSRQSPIRVVTAASLFDGHDAAINIMRRILQAQGAEVIHLGHDRSVEEIAAAAVQEDAHAVAVSSYQGGHMEFFRYLVDQLAEYGAGHIRVYGGGGGTITKAEADALGDHGVARIFLPEDGRALGLEGMIGLIIEDCTTSQGDAAPPQIDALSPSAPAAIARAITWMELHPDDAALAPALARLDAKRARPPAPVVGITGTGGSGKSSLVDELVRRFRNEFPDRHIGMLLVDPTRRRSGGALLGDRIRMNSIGGSGVFARSLATRQAHLALSGAVGRAIRVLQAADFDLILVETAGIGQSDSEIIDLADASIYAMTPEYGAPSQLEKIDMLDLADFVVINKFDRAGSEDALRDIRKQWRRNHTEFSASDAKVPVFPTVARQWNDAGVNRLYVALREVLAGGELDAIEPLAGAEVRALISGSRTRYLAEVADTVRSWKAETDSEAERAADAAAIARTLKALGAPVAEEWKRSGDSREVTDDPTLAALCEHLRGRYDASLAGMDESSRQALAGWPAQRAVYAAPSQEYSVRGKSIRVDNFTQTLSSSALPKVALPRTRDAAELLRFVRLENVPGRFPFTAGVFPFERQGEDPTRMFAGEGAPEQTNLRFHILARSQPAARLSTAFDSVTLYGRDADERPDIYGKVGNSGVSICTIDDAKKLYSGFDLCAPSTSVSMTINGPAPMILAFFLNAAIDQGVEKHLQQTGRLDEVVRQLAERDLPRYDGALPEGHSGLGLALLGVSGEEFVDADSYERIRSEVLRSVRGTVQADILKEDQAQNTCIFSTDFALSLMGDVQEFFIQNQVRGFYSVSVSGYHIAEAGANPITQLAFTLANGFTLCEYYLARGMNVDDFASNFSFFFSNGLDAEYTVIGRVARRIWAIAMREMYGASESSQKLKYHTQTSGRSLHAQEMAFNDIRTTLQALMALQDRCNSLHTNAYDEAVTTPTEESVRRAVAIQLIINRELGLSRNENPLQGSYVVEELTDIVEEAVLQEFERLSSRGGVLGAMETQYQRGKIQDESLAYEMLKDSGELPIIGVNTFESPEPESHTAPSELIRSSDEQKQRQLKNLRDFQARHAEQTQAALESLSRVARDGGNVFLELMDTVKVASLQQITETLFSIGGRYRRSM